MILRYINTFIDYGISKNLISVYDSQYVFNQLINIFDIKDPSDMEYAPIENLELHEILEFMLGYALKTSLFQIVALLKKIFLIQKSWLLLPLILVK